MRWRGSNLRGGSVENQLDEPPTCPTCGRVEPPTPEPSPRYSIVVPIYGNEGSIGALLDRIDKLSPRLDGRLEAVFVVDGSPDGSAQLLRRLLPEAGFDSQLVCHSRNFGAFAAVRTGLAAARGDMIAVMAADLQEPAELVESFFQHLSTGDHDIAVGTRTGREDPWGTSLLSKWYWAFYRRFVNREIPAAGVDIFGCTRAVAEHLLRLEEANSSLVGLLYWLGYRRIEVPYRRAQRESGKSGWSLRRRLRYFLDSVFSFTDVPITILTALGVIGGALTLVASAVVLVARLTGAIEQAGYAPLMLVILLSTFLLLFGIGVVGSYVWRTFENSKGRPAAVAMTHEEYRAAP